MNKLLVIIPTLFYCWSPLSNHSTINTPLNSHSHNYFASITLLPQMYEVEPLCVCLVSLYSANILYTVYCAI